MNKGIFAFLILLVGIVALLIVKQFWVDHQPVELIPFSTNETPAQTDLKPIENGQANSNSNQDHTIPATDYSEIERASREVELCQQAVADNQDSHDELKQIVIESLIEGQYPVQDLQRIMHYVFNSRLMDVHQASAAFEQVFVTRYDQTFPVISEQELQEQGEFAAWLRTIEDGFSLAKSKQRQAFLDLINRLAKNDIRGYRIADKELGYAEVIHFELLINYTLGYYRYDDPEFVAWLANEAKLSTMAISHAIRDNHDTQLIIKLLKQSPNAHELHFSVGQSIGSPLRAALENNRSDLVEHILERNMYRKPAYSVPDSNHYLAAQLRGETLDPSAMDMLKLLSQHNRPLVFTSSENGQLRLQGYPWVPISKAVTDELKQAKITAKIARRKDLPNEAILPQPIRARFVELTEMSSQLQSEQKQLKQHCVNKQAHKTSLIPALLQVDKLDDQVDVELGFVQLEQAFSTLSPVLVDEYYRRGLETLNQADQAKVEEVFAALQATNGDFAAINDQVSRLGPHQQEQLTVLALEHYGQSGLSNAIEQAWYFRLYNHDIMRFGFELEASDVIVDHVQSIRVSPSRIYNAVSLYKFEDALDWVDDFEPSNGFPYGRDTLALTLDRLFLGGKTYYQNNVELLERLLVYTELDDMHLRRLHRLKLDKPILFERLAIRFPQIEAATNYPISRHASL